MSKYKVVYINEDTSATDTNFVKSISPYSETKDIKDAYYCEIEWADKDDSEAIENSAECILETIETLFKSKLNTILVRIVDAADMSKEYYQYRIESTSSKLLGMSSKVNPLTKEQTDEITELTMCLLNGISDLMLRLGLFGKSFHKVVDDMKDSLGMSSKADFSGAKDDKELIEAISKKTKAEVVRPKETLVDYVCSSLLKEELSEIVDFFKNRKVYQTANVEIPKGILFKGPPGTGKTFAARCIAGSVDCYFMVCTASALQGMYIGSGAENIRNVFKGAKALVEKTKKGVIVFIDELDSFGSRDTHGGGAGGEEDRTLNQLLAEMSGFTEDNDIMVLSATNYPERLDDALMRSGRFGRQITIEYPNDEERKNLISHYFGKIKFAFEADTTIDDIVPLTKSMTPADIKEVANETGILTIRTKAKEITLDNINEAINKTITKNIRHPDKDKKELILVTAHECGHVLAEILYNKTYPVKVTNYSYGDAGGFTQMAKSLTGIIPEDKFIAKIKVALAGRAAEQVLCGYITNGASADLREAKSIMKHYYDTYHFKRYEVEELDQIVVDEIDVIYNQVIKDFKEDKNLTILKALSNELFKKRVLYTSDFVVFADSLMK